MGDLGEGLGDGRREGRGLGRFCVDDDLSRSEFIFKRSLVSSYISVMEC
jgi:hypothetical protein